MTTIMDKVLEQLNMAHLKVGVKPRSDDDPFSLLRRNKPLDKLDTNFAKTAWAEGVISSPENLRSVVLWCGVVV